MDLGDCLAGHYRIVWCCRACYASAEVEAEILIRRHGPAKTILALEREARCRAKGCGSPGRVFPRAKVMASPGPGARDPHSFSTPGRGR